MRWWRKREKPIMIIACRSCGQIRSMFTFPWEKVHVLARITIIPRCLDCENRHKEVRNE